MRTELCVSLGELASALKSEPRVSFDSKAGKIWIRVAYPYPIEASRIEDARDILSWVRHLSRKTWATRSVIAEFIDVVARVKGINTKLQK